MKVVEVLQGHQKHRGGQTPTKPAGQEMEKPWVVWMCTYSQRRGRRHLPFLKHPENRNCHHSSEAISQVKGQTANLPVLCLASILPSQMEQS